MAAVKPGNNILISLRPVLCSLVLLGIPGCQKTKTTDIDADATASSHTTVTEQASIADVIKENSRVIDEIGKAAALMTECSDIIMRYSHFTDNHTEQVIFCPECGTRGPVHEEPEIEDTEEEYPATIDQLLKDSDELRRGVGSIIIGLRLQRTGLRHHLKRLRENLSGHRSSSTKHID
ncbi:MAG: hypothetical protein MK102_18010 [Fuerstiella sp.]|nr:hypothetical protein [Fuerstiella sp.]